MSKKPSKPGSASNKERGGEKKSVTTPGGTSPWVDGLSIIALVGVTLLLFAESFSAGFTFDDFLYLVDNPRIQNWEFNLDPWYRWRKHVRALTFMIDYSLFGDSPTGYHVHNLLWHVICVLLLYVLVKQLSNRVSIAFLTALLFAIHPIHVEAITNISNRKDLLCLAFLLAACSSYIEFTRRAGPQRVAWLTTGVGAWILALFSKHVAIMLPLYLMAYEYLYVPKEKRWLPQNPLILAGGFIAGATLLLVFIFVRGAINLENLHESQTFSGYTGEPTLFTVAITSARMFWRYVGLLIWPNNLCPDHLEALSQSLLEPMTILSWFGLIAVVAAAFLVARRFPLISFGTFWFLISYLPISNLLPTSYLLADRYMYIPSVGFCMVLVCLGDALYEKLRGFNTRYALTVITIVGCIPIVGYSVKTLAYVPAWENDRTLWQYALKCNPVSSLAYLNLGVYHLRKGDFPEAIEPLSKSIDLGHMKAYEQRGNAYFGIKNYEAAIRDYNRALDFDPEWATVYYDRGVVYFQMGQHDQAIDDYSRALELKPDFSKAYNNRGLVYEKLERREEALEDFEMATKLDPENGPAHNNLGRALVFSGRFNEAIESYQRAEDLGITQATKILEILTQKRFPKNQNPSAPPSSPKESQEIENRNGGLTSD